VPPDRPRRLGDDERDIVPVSGQSLEGRQGELRGPEEDDPHGT